MARSERSRRWLLTINNPSKYNLDHASIKTKLLDLVQIKYWCMADEIGDEGTYHTHLFIWFENQERFNGIKDKFPEAHIDKCLGTAEEVRNYVLKQGHEEKAHTKVEGTFEESNKWEEATSKLTRAKNLIAEGSTIVDVIDDNPDLLTQISSLEKYKSLLEYDKYSRIMRNVEVIYKYGTSGTGKSSSIYAENTDWSDVYVVQDYLHPFDSYNGQSIIVFEEYRSNFMLTNMLQYLDRYPVQLPARYANRMAQFTKIYVVSNILLVDQYAQCDEASRQAFLRRFNKVEYYYDDHIDTAQVIYQNGKYTLELRESRENIYSSWYRNQH